MGSREKDQAPPHQPLLSSLVVRATDTGGGASGGDYEPGEVRRDQPPPYSRSDRFLDDHGGNPRNRGFGNSRDPGRYRDYSPPHYGRGRDGARISGKVFDGPGYGQGTLRRDTASRNNPNVRPRDGDWFCPDPACNNLNFARREFCNNCKRPRYASGGSPRRGYPGPPPPLPRRLPGPSLDRSPGRFENGHRSPPRAWVRDDFRDFRAGGPPYPRPEGRFPDPQPRRGRADYPEDDYGERSRFDRPMPLDWVHRDRGRESFLNERKGYERRMPSPPLTEFPPRGQWDREFRDRSRSPVRGGAPPKDYHRDMYMERGLDDRRGMGRIGY